MVIVLYLAGSKMVMETITAAGEVLAVVIQKNMYPQGRKRASEKFGRQLPLWRLRCHAFFLHPTLTCSWKENWFCLPVARLHALHSELNSAT